MKRYNVLVTVDQIVDDADLDYDDAQDNPSGTYYCEVTAEDNSRVETVALDEFHSRVPITVLEHFNITTYVEEA